MKISARNQFEGTVLTTSPGSVNVTLKVDIGGGNIVTATIATEAAEELGIQPGDEVRVIVKATDVMIGK